MNQWELWNCFFKKVSFMTAATEWAWSINRGQRIASYHPDVTSWFNQEVMFECSHLCVTSSLRTVYIYLTVYTVTEWVELNKYTIYLELKLKLTPKRRLKKKKVDEKHTEKYLQYLKV